MKNTGYECSSDRILDKKRAYGYICNTDTNVFGTCRFIDMSTARSAGGIYSTIEDLYRFDRFLYGEKLLKTRTKNLMFKPIKEEYALG
jgi:CubicO group peptidase (beta-lactamase class C family)